MSVSCGKIIEIIEDIAPRTLALPGDPVGLQLGSPAAEVERLYFALELNDEVVEDALTFGADLVILHHTPMYFPFRELSDGNYNARLTLSLAKGGAALYTAHTNLDCAQGGVNDVLAELLGLKDCRPLNLWEEGKAWPMGRIGRLTASISLAEFAAFVAQTLQNPCVRFVGKGKTAIRQVACLGGAGIGVMREAKRQGAEVLVTGDVRHHEALDALGLGLCLIDAGHFCTEHPAMAALAAQVKAVLPQELKIRVSQISTNPFQPVKPAEKRK